MTDQEDIICWKMKEVVVGGSRTNEEIVMLLEILNVRSKTIFSSYAIRTTTTSLWQVILGFHTLSRARRK